jgi:hypothetical protein
LGDRRSLLLCLSTSSGCMVMDEIDAAAAMMPAAKKSKDDGKAEALNRVRMPHSRLDCHTST